ncbi:hypothetical protein N0V86_001350 [Didymella sp. IMI 355093]|nr:hypothetical protein N0V86_001350 [Didymella sp. IMI 355093]
MSFAPIGLLPLQTSGVGPRPQRHHFLSKEEHAFLAAHEYAKAFERIREEEELKHQAKEQRKRDKREKKAETKAQAAKAKGHTLGPKKTTAQRLKTFLKVKSHIEIYPPESPLISIACLAQHQGDQLVPVLVPLEPLQWATPQELEVASRFHLRNEKLERKPAKSEKRIERRSERSTGRKRET